MTVKLELRAAGTKRSDTYSPELCAFSFVICLTGWDQCSAEYQFLNL